MVQQSNESDLLDEAFEVFCEEVSKEVDFLVDLITEEQENLTPYTQLILRHIEFARLGVWESEEISYWVAEAFPILSVEQAKSIERTLAPAFHSGERWFSGVYPHRFREAEVDMEACTRMARSQHHLLHKRLRALARSNRVSHTTLLLILHFSREFLAGLDDWSTKRGSGETSHPRVTGQHSLTILFNRCIARSARNTLRILTSVVGSILPRRLHSRLVRRLLLPPTSVERLWVSMALPNFPLATRTPIGLQLPWIRRDALGIVHLPSSLAIDSQHGTILLEGRPVISTSQQSVMPPSAYRLLERGTERTFSRVVSVSGQVVKIQVSGRSSDYVREYVHVFDAGSANYFHAVLEGLGTLAVTAETSNFLVGKTILIPESVPPQVKRMTQFLAQTWGADTCSMPRVRSLEGDVYFLSATPPTMSIEQNGRQWRHPNLPFTKETVRSLQRAAKMYAQSISLPDDGRSRIVITRGRSRINGWRRFSDQLVIHHGFHRYEPTQESGDEQVAIFSNAAIVAAEAGSALTNLIFCRPGSLVIVAQMLGTTVFSDLAAYLNLQVQVLDVRPRDLESVQLGSSFEYWYFHRDPVMQTYAKRTVSGLLNSVNVDATSDA